MSRKIHHGPNGSYKTSGALADDLLPAVIAGRTVVSNVRGLEDKALIENACYKSFPLLERIKWAFMPSTAPVFDWELIYINTEHPHNSEQEIEKMRSFFHWMPRGSLIIIDEVDEIYDPQEFTKTKLDKYDYPAFSDDEGNLVRTSQQNAVFNDKPRTLKTAFSKHRHWNWDFITTCTDISNVHPMIIKGSDTAFRHINMINTLGLLGKGKYREIAHNPKTQGRFTDAQSNVIKKIPSYVFGIYKSTKTGKVQDSIAGTSIWKGNKKLRYMVYLVLMSFGWSTYSMMTNNPISNIGKKEGDINVPAAESNKPVNDNKQYAPKINTKVSQVKTSHISSDNVPDQKVDNVLNDLKIKVFFDSLPPIIDFMGKPYIESYYGINGKIKFTTSELKSLGVSEVFVTSNMGYLQSGNRMIVFRSNDSVNKSFINQSVQVATQSVKTAVTSTKANLIDGKKEGSESK